jgi:hypothetical protein
MIDVRGFGMGQGEITIDRCNPVVDNLEILFAIVFSRLLRFKLQGNHCEVPVVRGCNRGLSGVIMRCC